MESRSQESRSQESRSQESPDSVESLDRNGVDPVQVRKRQPVKNVWALCVFKKSSDLKQFYFKWGDPTHCEIHKRSNKNYHLTTVTELKIPIAMCVCKNLATESIPELDLIFKKAFKYRELILFCTEKESIDSIIRKLGIVSILRPGDPGDQQLLRDFLGHSESSNGEEPCPNYKRQKISMPPILPSVEVVKLFPVKELPNGPAGVKECSVCMANCATETMSPCGHLCMCYDCMDQMYQSDQINKCIICKSTVFGIQHTFTF